MSGYPFELWFNGDLHVLYQGVDFVGTTMEMKSVIQQAALFMGVDVGITVTVNTIVVRSVNKTSSKHSRGK